jgi:ATP-dependent helicase/nuclease subunit A
MKWTEDQRSAILSRGQDLLLSAAAGSGKTTVLVERALSLIQEGADIGEFLIVTFSRAAAADMRRKLTEELMARSEQDPAFAPQLEKVERAQVSTIHSFCADLLREHFESAGVDPLFRVLDEPELKQLEAQALGEAMERAYAEGGSDLDALCYGRTAKAVGALATELYRFSLENPDPEGWLRAACEEMPLSDGEAWFDELSLAARAQLRDARALCAYALALTRDPDGPAPYAAALSSDLEAIEAMLSAPGYRALVDEVALFKHEALAQIRKPKNAAADERRDALRDQVKALRDEVKDLVASAKKMLMNPEDALADMRELAPALRALSGIARTLGEELDSLKAEKSALSYQDLEHRAIRALSDERVAASLRARYRYVFVDEYQDVSDVQEAILRAVTEPGRLFMVGDVKQSIYRFRQADPSLFLEKYHRFGRGEGGEMVALKQNFRSRATVLELVNRVFERVMTGGDAEIEYDDAARLRPGAAFEGDDPPVELHILEKPDIELQEGDEAEFTNAEREGAVIASRIRSLLGAPYFDARGGAFRPLEYRDFVVLVRTRAAVPAVEAMLTRFGIPVYADVAGGYFGVLEVELAIALLRVIDNRRRDLELMSALRSPFGGLTSTDLAEIRLALPKESFRDAMLSKMKEDGPLPEKLRAFEEKLGRWRALSRVLPLGRFVDLVLRESGAYAYAGGMPGGSARQANLDLLCDYASNYEAAQGGALNGFLSYFREIKKSGDDIGAAHSLGEEDQVVRIMTIHKSKGLEFPVVCACELGRRLNAAGRRGDLTAHRALGAGLRLNDPSLGSSRETISQAATLARLSREDYNEEMRILYVLLTRAIDRLILVGRVSRKDARARFQLCGEAGLRPMSYLEAMEPAARSMGTACEIAWHGALEAEEAAEATAAAEAVTADDPALREAILWRYPFEERVMMPLKLTVSGLAREETGPRSLPPLGKRPLFMTEEGPRAAEYGTLTHAALMAADLDALRPLSGPKLTRELERQIGYLRTSGRLYGDVEPGLIARFFEGKTGQRLLKSPRVEREWSFNLRVDSGGERFLVQGVIDCCFLEDGQWVLLDYKTDRADDLSALLERYRPQIDWYAKALEKITGIPVKERLICLLRAGLELTA